MNYNDLHKAFYNDFLIYKKKVSVKIGNKKIFMTEDCYLMFLKKIKEKLQNWLYNCEFVNDKEKYSKLMDSLIKWIKN